MCKIIIWNICQTVIRRITRPANIKALCRSLDEEKWESLDESTNAEEMYNVFNNVFTYHLENTCPRTKITTKKDQKKIEWITKGILTSLELN